MNPIPATELISQTASRVVKRLYRMAGVYCIKQISKNKYYVGSAKNIGPRWLSHLNGLNNKQHHNKHLQRAWDKYGFSDFHFEILEIVNDLSRLISKEQEFLKLFQAYKGEFGFNISPIAGSCLGVRHTDKSRLNMSKAKLGRGLSNTHKHNIALALTGRKRSIETRAKMSTVAKQRLYSDDTRMKMSQSAKRRAASPQERQRCHEIQKLANYKHRQKSYSFYDPSGKKWFITGLKEFCRKNNLHASAMCRLAKGYGKSHKNWRATILETRNLLPACMRRVAIGERRHHKQWRCYYYE